MSNIADVSLGALLAGLSAAQRNQVAKEITGNIRSSLYKVNVTKLELVLTERCNFSCHYCFLGTHGKGRDMSPEVAEKAITFALDRLLPDDELTIVLFGGEPLVAMPLIRHIVDFVKSTAKPGQKVNYDCTSNGSLITDEIAQYLSANGIMLLLSFDGTKESHDLHRRFNDDSPTFDAVMDGFQILRKYQPWIGARITFSPETVHRLADDVIWLNQNGICQFVIGIASGTAWSPEKLAEIEPQLLKLADYYRDIHVEGRLPLRITEFEESLADLEQKSKGYWGCGAARNTVAVTPDGTMYPCSRFSSLFNCEGDYKIGSITDGINNFAALHDLHDNRAISHYPCYDCELSNICSGSCPAANLESMRNIYVAEPAACAFLKAKVAVHQKRPDLHKIKDDFPMMRVANAEYKS